MQDAQKIAAMKTAVAVLCALSAGVIFANETRDFKHPKAKFSVRYPADWTLAPEKEGVPFMVTSPDNTANVQIMTDRLKDRMTACDYLTKTEAAADGGRQNLIAEPKRRANETQLKFIGASDSCLGAYKITLGNAEVLQGTAVYTAGKNVWILIQTLPTGVQDRYAQNVGEIAKSFSLK